MSTKHRPATETGPGPRRPRGRRAVQAVAAVAAALAATLVAGCEAADPGGPAAQRLTLPSDAGALFWLADGSLLIETGGSLLLYDPELDRPIEALAVPGPEVSIRGAPCLSDEGGVVDYAGPRSGAAPGAVVGGAGAAGGVGGGGAGGALGRGPHRYTGWRGAWPVAIHRQGWWTLNPFDCTDVPRADDRRSSLTVDGRPRERSTGFGQLLHSERGITDLYEVDSRLPAPGDYTGARRLRVVAWGPDGEPLGPGVEIELPFHHGSLDAGYDRVNDRYLWTTASQRGFNARPEDWHLRAWLMAPDLTLVRSVTLPAGPWIYRESLWKGLSCFSCGCTCYEHLEVRFENDAVWLMVHGRAVKDEHQGLYRFHLSDPAGTDWTPVVLGSLDRRFAVAPDGCRVAYRQGADLLVTNACVPRSR